MSIQVRVVSFIRTIPDGEPLGIFEGESNHVLSQVREQCTEKGKNIEEWSTLIREHGKLPQSHPFSQLCDKLDLMPTDSLRTLGSWAFGFDNSWIVIEWIRTESGIIPREEFDPNYHKP